MTNLFRKERFLMEQGSNNFIEILLTINILPRSSFGYCHGLVIAEDFKLMLAPGFAQMKKAILEGDDQWLGKTL
jgi:hypothetical protein